MTARRWRGLIAALAAACTPAAEPNNNLDILDGVWDFTAVRTVASPSTTCDESGTYVLVSPDGLTLRGTVEWDGVCDDGIGGPTPTAGKDSIRSATMQSGRVVLQRVALTGGAARCPDTLQIAPTLAAFSGRSVCAGYTITVDGDLVGTSP